MKVAPTYNLILNQTNPTNLQELNQKLHSLNQNKNELLAAVSHEIRNPLSIVYNCAELLEMDAGAGLSTECLEYIENIKTSTQEALSFISDLLDVSQANSGKFSSDISNKIDIKSTILRSIKLNQHLAMKHKISISSQIENDLPLINLDEKRIKQILVNLISNSVKYSNPKTEIKISAHLSSDKKQLEIIVADQGFGMSDKEISLAMKKYSVIENPNSNNVDAFGLGLPLVKQLVETQNGEMLIKSNKGQGTEINLRFNLL